MSRAPALRAEQALRRAWDRYACDCDTASEVCAWCLSRAGWDIVAETIDRDYDRCIYRLDTFLESFRIPAANTPVYFRFTE